MEPCYMLIGTTVVRTRKSNRLQLIDRSQQGRSYVVALGSADPDNFRRVTGQYRTMKSTTW
jgi:hypothetical protein